MKFKNYSELMQYVDNNDTTYLLQYNDFAVVEINSEYWYFRQGEMNDCDEFYQVELIAQLDYNIQNDLQNNGEYMHNLFDCNCCGETDVDDNGDVSYLWFKEKENNNE